ncbi:receptor-type tyrosine-protein phosphatase N2-like [Engraulis encrasicolus]|uniref:receptor-type tyrosine-protein phosphatase N2-like n=1 Tax=Engraulis encrasicolus TaxID=184585 RepID=UPI002FD22657
MVAFGVLVLTLLLSRIQAAERGKVGCLFASGLCEDHESCVNDALFGQCLLPGAMPLPPYDITRGQEVDRLRSVLQQLGQRGLSWEDEVTQRVLSRELAKLNRTPQRSRPILSEDEGEQEVMSQGAWQEAGQSRRLEKYLQQLLAKEDGRYSQWKSEAGETMLLLAALQKYLDQPSSQKPRTRLFRSHDVPDTPPARFRPMADEESLRALRDYDEDDEDGGGNEDEMVARDLDRNRDQLERLIASALPQALQQEDEEEEGEEEEERKAPAEKREDGNGNSSDDEKLLLKLLQFLDRSSSPSPLDPAPSPPWFPRQLKNHQDDDDDDANNNGRRRQGVSTETVKSRVSQREDRQLLQVQIATEEEEQQRQQLIGVKGHLQGPQGHPQGHLQGRPAVKVHPPPPSSELQLDVQSKPSAGQGGGGLSFSVSNLEEGGGDGAYGYVITDKEDLATDKGLELAEILARRAKIHMDDFLDLSVKGSAIIFQIRTLNSQNVTTADVVNIAVDHRSSVERESKLKILEAGLAEKSQLRDLPTKYSRSESTKFLILTVLSLLCIVGVLLASLVVYCVRHRAHLKDKLTNLNAADAANEAYQELCRQRVAMKPTLEKKAESALRRQRTASTNQAPHASRLGSLTSQLSDSSVGMAATNSVSPSRTSPSPWSEEPMAMPSTMMDISTGHMILSYMEDHLANKDRLQQEWEGLCAYEVEPSSCEVGRRDGNAKKNRSSAVVAYDHSRFKLRVENSQSSSDYINASPIMDHDPRYPAYIATQGPLPSTVADFWQMVWESGAVVIVMLTPLVESGVKQSHHYWPDEGSNLYHIYEVNLVSEHVWCEDFLVRSFYLKNMQSNESRTVSQFHLHTWGGATVPDTQTLLDFRRKVNKCYRGRSCPIIVHCSDGAGRTGTYILIDMVLNKMSKGAKEIDIAATLEHLRDQRANMVQTKEQFEFVLTTVAEEVNGILKALPQ